MTLHLFRPSTPAVESLTGHPLYTLTGSATSALAVLTSICHRNNDSLAIPALGCWAIAQAAVMGGMLNFRFMDVGADLYATPNDTDRNGYAIYILPWFGNNQVPEGSGSIIDLSINCTYIPNNEHSLATVVSFGPGKPGYWPKRGALLTVRDLDIARDFESVASLGLLDSCRSWLTWAPRVTFIEGTDEEVDRHIKWINSIASIRQAQAEYIVRTLKKSCNNLKEINDTSFGNSTLIPFVYSGSGSLTEILPHAVRENLPIGVQPIYPAYLQPALSNLNLGGVGDCPNAEFLSSRLCFVPTCAYADHGKLQRLISIIDEIGG